MSGFHQHNYSLAVEATGLENLLAHAKFSTAQPVGQLLIQTLVCLN
jgi:hypothetical protein